LVHGFFERFDQTAGVIAGEFDIRVFLADEAAAGRLDPDPPSAAGRQPMHANVAIAPEEGCAADLLGRSEDVRAEAPAVDAFREQLIYEIEREREQCGNDDEFDIELHGFSSAISRQYHAGGDVRLGGSGKKPEVRRT
jgi:hypothetical protein